MSRGMNTELMRRLWIKLNCWPETVSLQKTKKGKRSFHPFHVYFPLHDHQYEWKWKEAQCKKCDEWFVALLPPRTIVCGPIAAQNSTHCWNQAMAMYCVYVWPMLKANYSIVMYRVVSGQNAPIVWVIQLDWNAQFYTKKVYENFVCRSNRLRVHHPQTSYLSFFSTQIFSTQIFLHIDLAQKRHKLW